MESFFGRLKTAIMDVVALCKDYDSASSMVDGYLKAYNSEHYQYDIAGLTPEEFYQYATTGIYPLDSYFGVPASAMMTGGDFKKVRRRYADEEAAKRREASRKKREEKRQVDPLKIVQRDKKMIKHVISAWNDKKDVAVGQIAKMEQLLHLIEKAFEFLKTLAKEKLEELKEPLVWRNYEELRYVFAMNELF